MRRLALNLIILIACCSPLPAQTALQNRSLQLTTKVIDQRFCAGSSVNFLHLKVRLQYRNIGPQKLILYKGNNLFFQAFVSPDSARPSFRLMTTASRYLETTPEALEASSPGRDFVTLSPGASYETEMTVSLPVARPGGESVNGAIGVGDYLLAITVSTWYESRQMAERLRERWKKHGLLWTSSVTAASVKFSSAGSYSSSGC